MLACNFIAYEIWRASQNLESCAFALITSRTFFSAWFRTSLNNTVAVKGKQWMLLEPFLRFSFWAFSGIRKEGCPYGEVIQNLTKVAVPWSNISLLASGNIYFSSLKCQQVSVTVPLTKGLLKAINHMRHSIQNSITLVIHRIGLRRLQECFAKSFAPILANLNG